MHNAPPVVYPVGRFVWGRWFLVSLAGVGALGLHFVQSLRGAASLPWAWVWALWALLVMVSVFLCVKERLPDGFMAWSGEAWCCVEHVYEHAHVRLYFYICREWLGEPQSLEGLAPLAR